MNSSAKIRRIILFSLLMVIGIILVTTPISDVDENSTDEKKEDNLATSNPSYVYKDVYTVCKEYTTEYKVTSIPSLNTGNMGDGHFHIKGPVAAVGKVTIRGRLDFGFNNPYREESGHPVSYRVTCSVRYKNWNDDDGYVALYVLHDFGWWIPLLYDDGIKDHVTHNYNVDWTPASPSWYYRDDGTMNFRIVGQSVEKTWLDRPSCQVNVYDLKVRLKYDSAKIRPVGEVYTVGKKYTSERDCHTIDSKSVNNLGDGNFHIRGYVRVPWPYTFPFPSDPPQKTRARLTFGFNNPVYAMAGAPAQYTVKCKIRYKNWNDDDGYVKLYALHDDGTWDVIWQRTGIGDHVPHTWTVSWNPIHYGLNPAWYYRDDGSMDFKIVGESTEKTWWDRPSVQVNIWDLRVHLNYVPHADAGGPYYDDEGSSVFLDARGSYDPTENLLYRWDFNNDGNWDTGWSSSPTISHTWNDNYIGNVKVQVWDSKYTVTDTAWANIKNVAPIVEAGPDREDYEGWVTLSNGFHDPGKDDTHTIEWDFGDGSPVSNIPTHRYKDNGTYTVTLNVTDDDGGVGIDSFELLVNNVAPMVYAGPDQTVAKEGEIVNFNGYFSDPGIADTHTIQWDFGDGTPIVTGTLTPGHIYYNNGTYTVTLTVTDDDGGVGTDTLEVKVGNIPPTVDIGPDKEFDEGETVSFSGTVTDPGDFAWTLIWNFGDGGTAYGTLTPEHAYGDNGVYPVTLTAIDDDGNIGSDTLIVTVNNVAPTADAGLDQTVDEGDTVSFLGDPNDPGADDTHIYEWDFGDLSNGTGPDPSHAYGDNGVYTVTLTVTDDDGGVSSDTLVVTVNNVIPIVDAGPDQTVDEGDTVYISDDFDDPGWLDTHNFEWDFGDDSPTDTETLTQTHVYGDNGVYTVTLTVTDDDGGVGSDTLTVTVDNVAPIIDAGSDVEADEGDTISFDGVIDDPGWLDNHTIEWDFDDGNTATETLIPNNTYGDNGVYTVTLTVTDDDGGVSSDTLTVTINNVAPTADAGPDQTVDEGETVSFLGNFTDPGIDDTHTIEWDFGDGSPPVTGTLTPTHAYRDNDVYNVTLTITDDYGDVGSDNLTVIVNNVAPTTDAGPDQTVDEGETIYFLGSFDDPGADDTHTIEWYFGDGSPTVTDLDTSYVYEVPGTYTASLTVTDDDGGAHTDYLVVTVLDITPPNTTLTILPPYQGTIEPFYVSTTTEFVLSAEDGDGFGVAKMRYRIDDGDWINHTGDLLSFFIPDIGFHTIHYYSIDVVGNEEEEKSMEVIVNASELTYTGEVSGVYSDPVLLNATLIDIATQLPIPGKIIEFTIGSQTDYAVTDIYGNASYILILDQPNGSYSVSASFAGDTEYLASSDIHAFTLEKENVYAIYTGDSVIPTTVDTITLRATVFDEDDGYWGDLTRIHINFTIYNENYLLLQTHSEWVDTTNVDGVGKAIKDILKTLNEGGYLIKVSFDPNENDYYQGPDSDFVVLVIYKPSGDFVTGGGWIEDTEGYKGNFGFNVKYRKNGLPRGKAIYVYREGDFVFIVKSNAWIGMAIDHENNHSFFEAKCNVKQINSTTGEIVWEKGNYKLRIDVWDHSKNGKNDVFQIRVYDQNGLIYHEAGFEPNGVLQGGNIVIHVDDKKK